MSNLEWVRRDGVGRWEAESGGGGSLMAAFYEPEADATVNPGGNIFLPTNVWTTERDDVGALSEFADEVVLPNGIWLCGGMLDTSNAWPAEATGYVAIGVIGGSSPTNLFSHVPYYGISTQANSISAAIYVPPVLIVAHDDGSEITLRGKNMSDQTMVVSGCTLWAIKVADLPT